MDLNYIIFVVVELIAFTLLYKSLPHRNIENTKPSFSVFPKFKTKVKLPATLLESENVEKELEEVLSEYGFVKKSQKNSVTKYSRGHVLGDFSIKLLNINLLVTKPQSGVVEFAIEAGWVAAFDTGDFWQFLTELKTKVETKEQENDRNFKKQS